MVKAVALVVLLALVSCQTPKGSYCALATPIRPSAATIAAMSDAEVRQALAHNETGRKLCGWKP